MTHESKLRHNRKILSVSFVSFVVDEVKMLKHEQCHKRNGAKTRPSQCYNRSTWMHRKHAYFAIVFCLLLAPQLPAASRNSVAKRIDTILSTPDLARGFWGIEVVSLDTGKIIYAQNADKLFTPASNTKLFTTAAALALIGPDYTSRTTVETSGVLDKYGRLSDDLVLVGRGDPNLSGRELPYNLRTSRNDHPIQVLEQLADALVQKGIKYVDGNIIADDSYFAFERYGEGWSQDDLVLADGAPVSALTINDNVVFANILPADRAGSTLSSVSRLSPITIASTIASSLHLRAQAGKFSSTANPGPRWSPYGVTCRWMMAAPTKRLPSKTLLNSPPRSSTNYWRTAASLSTADSARDTLNWRVFPH